MRRHHGQQGDVCEGERQTPELIKYPRLSTIDNHHRDCVHTVPNTCDEANASKPVRPKSSSPDTRQTRRHRLLSPQHPCTPAPITNTPAPNEGRPCWWVLPPPTPPNTPAPVPPKLTPTWALARSHREQQPHEPHHEHCVSMSVEVQNQEGCGWHELTGAWRSRHPCPPPARREAPAPPSPPSPPPP